MTSAAVALVSNEVTIASIQAHLDREIDDLIASLPDPGQLSAAALRAGMDAIARRERRKR